jgi:hypothetical protein
MHPESIPPQPRNVRLIAVKAVHTVVWFSIEASVIYVLVAGVRGRSDRRVAVAGAVVAGECLVFAANGFRCPLSDVAESLGAESGRVTDLYLPGWLADNLPGIHVPVVIAAVALHARNLRRQRAGRRATVPVTWPGAGRAD